MEFNMLGNLQKFAKIAKLLSESIDGLSQREQAQKMNREPLNLSCNLNWR
jgi:hypothetical protein